MYTGQLNILTQDNEVRNESEKKIKQYDIKRNPEKFITNQQHCRIHKRETATMGDIFGFIFVVLIIIAETKSEEIYIPLSPKKHLPKILKRKKTIYIIIKSSK